MIRALHAVRDRRRLTALTRLARLELDARRVDEAARCALAQDATGRDALRLWAVIKARRSWMLGRWWRFNAWISLRSERGQVALLMGSFVTVQVAISARSCSTPTLIRLRFSRDPNRDLSLTGATALATTSQERVKNS